MPFTQVLATHRTTSPEMSKLQVTLSAASAGADPTHRVLPHHPITCPGELRYCEDGSFACPHATAPPGDVRTRLCIDHSIALLIVELSHEL